MLQGASSNDPDHCSPPLPVVPQDVLDFATEQGVAQYLPALVELLPRVFPMARRFTVTVEDDPEIANDRHIVFDVYMPLGADAVDIKQRWNRESRQFCPGPLICVFRLSMNHVP
jgi:hypothetical protein